MNPTKTLAVVCALAAIVVPSASANKPSGTPSPNKQTTKSELPGPNASLSALEKAYGRYCQDHSKKHVPGQKGTPFSQCVTAMAKAAHGQSAKTACATLSKKHVAGVKGTPFSCCVKAAARLHKDQHQHT
jgi:hypothetical protein